MTQVALAKKPELTESWLDVLQDEFEKPYMQELKTFLKTQKQQQKVIYPKGSEYFAALNHTPYDQVKVVILGQDPYHGPNQAHGLCFSVKPGVRPPPSLVNIYKELKSDLGVTPVNHGYLIEWANQGVLLLNAVLTVQAGLAASHRGKGWETFTDQVVQLLNEKNDNLIFVLWGSDAQRKGSIINQDKHVVLRAPHPSPLSANRGFFGCKHFSQINKNLEKFGKQPINWQLSENPTYS